MNCFTRFMPQVQGTTRAREGGGFHAYNLCLDGKSEIKERSGTTEAYRRHPFHTLYRHDWHLAESQRPILYPFFSVSMHLGASKDASARLEFVSFGQFRKR